MLFPVSGRQKHTKLSMFLATLLILTTKRVFTVFTITITSSFVHCQFHSLSYWPYTMTLYAYISSLPLPMPRAYTLIHYTLTANCKQIVTSTLFLPLTAPANYITDCIQQTQLPSLSRFAPVLSSTLSFAVELVLTVCFIFPPLRAAAMASSSSSPASYVSSAPQYSPVQNTGGLSTYQFPLIHHTNTRGLSLLLGMCTFFGYVSSSLT